MPQRLLLIVGLFWLGVLPAGCRLPGRGGPISPALAKCREYSQEGIIALEQRRWATAEKLLAKAVQSCPDDPEARRHYAEALWNRGRRDEAIDQLHKAVTLLPQDTALRVRMSQMRLDLGQIPQAQANVEAALDMEPTRGSAWAMRARVRHAAGDAAGALADYHRALGFAPDDRDLLLDTAELYRELNEPEKALPLLHRLADTYAPGEEPQKVIYLEGLAYAALGRCDEAAESYAAALARGPSTSELLYQLALVRSRAGHPCDALAAAEAAIRLQPDHHPARRLVEQLSARPPHNGPIRQ